VEPEARRITAQADGLGDMTRIGEVIGASGIQVDDLGLKRPSLDDVFLHLTGHRAEDEQEDGGSPGLDEGDKAFEEAVR
jgi:ABC-2 type transport system ATP-binding protein